MEVSVSAQVFSTHRANLHPGAPFKKFESLREEWAVKNCDISPGPIQFVGPTSDAVNHTLLLELGALA
ncbi:hypothetical protein MLD38_036810 [Melastoma candidum]|uniref:Uncharacterized protein n=1 Tax=Melastoma candidum TaxID=119954 RepID=A0ACB9LLT6_9MYRT|nr:hypothetical protein MLD38_036810 [Melastoma candidum]